MNLSQETKTGGRYCKWKQNVSSKYSKPKMRHENWIRYIVFRSRRNQDRLNVNAIGETSDHSDEVFPKPSHRISSTSREAHRIINAAKAISAPVRYSYLRIWHFVAEKGATTLCCYIRVYLCRGYGFTCIQRWIKTGHSFHWNSRYIRYISILRMFSLLERVSLWCTLKLWRQR